MTGRVARQYANWLSSHSKLVLVLVLVATVVVAAGAAVGDAEDGGLGDFDVDSDEFDAAAFIQENYGQDNTTSAQIVVRDEGGNVLTRESFIDGLRLQEDAFADEEIAATLTEAGFVGLENIVGTAAVFQAAEAAGEEPPTGTIPPEQQREALEALSDEEFDVLLEMLLGGDDTQQVPGDADPLQFLPAGFEPGETEADARLVLVTQIDESGEDEEPEAAYDAQVAIDALIEDRFDDAFVFGQGISNEASSNATGDSFALITPFALILILTVLAVSYRDVVDILLAISGIVVVMAWLQGIMGWLEIPMNVILISVPFLLLGLSIDYAVHMVMRYREARTGILTSGESVPSAETDGGTADQRAQEHGGRAVQAGIAVGLGSVVLAMAAATFAAGVGFLSNVVSPLPAIQDFAVLSGGGIFATFIAFGIFLPALKLEVDSLLEDRFGRTRAKPAFGASPGLANRVLGGIGSITWRAPVAFIVAALLLSTAGVYGATTIDTEFNQADFLPENPPAWTEYLPGPFQPGTYTISDDFAYLNENFAAGGGDEFILLQGEITSPELLAALDAESDNLERGGTIQFLPDGTPQVSGVHTAIREVAAENETFGAFVDQYDETGNGLPDSNVEAVYAELFAADEEVAATYLSRSGEEFTSTRLLVGVVGGESAQSVANDLRPFADAIAGIDADISAVATGEVVTQAVLQDALLETLVEAFAVTVVVILVFLTVLFWVRYRSVSLGFVTTLPVVMALTWLLGAMALLDIPFNSETAVITSLAIGLGAAYSIYAGERFMDERSQRGSVTAALEATMTGTGGALLASAATTAAAFGVLALALSPPLQRFGLVTGAAIIFAFVAVITVLPGLLVIRDRLQPGGVYRERPFDALRRGVETPAVAAIGLAGALAAGAAGWYLATVVFELAPTVGVTVALGAVVLVGALGVPILGAIQRRLRPR